MRYAVYQKNEKRILDYGHIKNKLKQNEAKF